MLLLAACSATSAAAETPKVTRDFLAFCKTNADGCDEYISAVHISALLSRTATYCYPKSATDSQANLKAVFRDVRTWIAAHPETFDRPTSDSVRAAYVALYPCRH
jgi:Rap1a immunity proteins